MIFIPIGYFAILGCLGDFWMDWIDWVLPLLANSLIALVGWLVSLRRSDVGVVDIIFPLFFVAGFLIVSIRHFQDDLGVLIAAGLLLIWSVRLSVHLFVRNLNRPEDRRYREIRAKYQDFFWKSLFIVFGFQAVAAWIVSAPLLVVAAGQWDMHWINWFAAFVIGVGIVVEGIADWQLSQFHLHKKVDNGVFDQGLWRYSRHPNYFGELCVWWGFYCYAVPAGGAWTVFSPLLMFFFLLRFTGVLRMEQGMIERRPAYAAYMARTSALFPAVPRPESDVSSSARGPGAR